MKYFISVCIAISFFKFLFQDEKNLGVKAIEPSICEVEWSDRKEIFKGETKIDGITLVAPPRPFPTDPMEELTGVGAGWVAVVPYASSQVGSTKVNYSHSYYWGESPKGAEETIRLAKANGLKVMLKPQVWVRGAWPGDIDFSDRARFNQWWESYKVYIQEYVQIAERHQVEILCIGTEFKQLSRKYPEAWLELIEDVRKDYHGKLTYAANWDEYEEVTFWDALDYIGVDAYFPLMETAHPSEEELVAAWEPYLDQMEKVSSRTKTPILFTEYGYLTVARCTWNTWELEKRLGSMELDEEAQAQALEALYRACWNKSWWHGGFIWKWFPKGSRIKVKGYTPQGKKAQEVIAAWYGKS